VEGLTAWMDAGISAYKDKSAFEYNDFVPEDPILWLGMDIGIKRDTTAITAVFHNYEEDKFGLYGHWIFEPPVNMVTQVEPRLMWLLETFRVGGLLFDPYQAATTTQTLAVAGYGDLLVEVNQSTEMVHAANILHALCTSGRLILYKDPVLRAHFSWANDEQTERGWHIKKRKQTMPIDGVVALAMSCLGITGETGHMQHPSYSTKSHSRSALLLP